jgi:PiT family inorganic phosphate transporter
MIDITALLTLLVAAGASLVMAWTIGAGSSGSTPFAPAVGANAISVMRAGFIVGLLGFAGAIIQGANVSEAIGRELIQGVSLSPLAATIGLLTAATLVSIGVFTGYPIATAFTVTGAIVGVGLAAGGTPAWMKYREIILLWIVTPFIGGGTAYITARALRDEYVSEQRLIPLLAGCIGLIVANMEFVVLGPSSESASIAAAVSMYLNKTIATGTILVGGSVSLAIAAGSASIVASDLKRDAVLGQRRFLLALGCLVAFSAGGSQVGLAIGPLLPLLDPFSLPILPVLVGGGFGLLLGSWMGAPRMIKALSQDYSSLGPRRSIAALIPAFLIAQTAIFLGIPISFNEIMVSTIIGSGFAVGENTVSRKKMVYTILAWIGSLLLSLGIGYGLYTLIESITVMYR